MQGDEFIVIFSGPRAKQGIHALFALALTATIAACSTSGQPPLSLALADSTVQPTDGTAALPETASVLPSARPDTETPATGALAKPPAKPLETAAAAAQPAEQTASAQQADTAAKPAPGSAAVIAATVTEQPAAVAEGDGGQQTQQQAFAASEPQPEKKPSNLMASLFGTSKPEKPAEAAVETVAEEKAAEAKPVPQPKVEEESEQKVALLDPQEGKQPRKIIKTISEGSTTSAAALPGVRSDPDDLFEITHRTSIEDDTNVDITEEDGSYQVASAAGLARLAPNGLRTQHSGVDVQCLKPALVRMLKTIERKYGRPVVITSGYRSPAYNRKVRGARKSLHMYCAAADIRVSGVSKWALASYLRSVSGRGGVGTYCHTDSVHVDIGPERDWNWRCRRRK